MAHNTKEHVCSIALSKSLITYSIHVNTYIAQFKFAFYLKIASNSMCVCVSYLSHLNSVTSTLTWTASLKHETVTKEIHQPQIDGAELTKRKELLCSR